MKPSRRPGSTSATSTRARLWAPGSLFAKLGAANSGDWLCYVDHRFVRELGRGTLPETAFRRYLGQDYLFLIHFARAWGLAAFKSASLAELRHALGNLKAILEVEIDLHVRLCARWGLTEARLGKLPEAGATLAYTRFVLERGLAGDLLDLAVALAPCIVGYAAIAERLIKDPATRLAGNPYREWIETYAANDYRAVARAATGELDRMWRARGSDGRFHDVARCFGQATRLEADFWQMGLGGGSPVR